MVPSVALARRMEQLGADAVIAEGTESGGHVGELTTMALVPQVAHGSEHPCCGGGRYCQLLPGSWQLLRWAPAACRWAPACCWPRNVPIHENYKQAVLNKAGDTSTVVTGRIDGTPVRVLKNKMTREYVKREKAGASKEELEVYTLGALRRAVFDGDDQERVR